MITVQSAVRETIFSDPIASEALRQNILNLSAYSQKIHKTVENRCMKPVQVGTIAVGLIRIKSELSTTPPLIPVVIATNLGVWSGLHELTYDKTDETLSLLATLRASHGTGGQFFAVTVGLNEITIICSQSNLDTVRGLMKQSAKAEIPALAAVSVRFSDSYLEVANTVYSLVHAVAAKRINVIEIVSTYTELIFVIRQQELASTVQTLETFCHTKSG